MCRTRGPLHQICHQERLWRPSMGVFEMHSAEKGVCLVWCAVRAYFHTKSAIKRVRGYLLGVCLKMTIPKNPCFGGAHRPRIPLHPSCHQKWVWILGRGLFGMHDAKKCVARQMRIPLHPSCHQKWFWIPITGVFEMCYAKKCGLLVWRAGTHIHQTTS